MVPEVFIAFKCNTLNNSGNLVIMLLIISSWDFAASTDQMVNLLIIFFIQLIGTACYCASKIKPWKTPCLIFTSPNSSPLAISFIHQKLIEGFINCWIFLLIPKILRLFFFNSAMWTRIWYPFIVYPSHKHFFFFPPRSLKLIYQ